MDRLRRAARVGQRLLWADIGTIVASEDTDVTDVDDCVGDNALDYGGTDEVRDDAGDDDVDSKTLGYDCATWPPSSGELRITVILGSSFWGLGRGLLG